MLARVLLCMVVVLVACGGDAHRGGGEDGDERSYVPYLCLGFFFFEFVFCHTNTHTHTMVTASPGS